MTLKAKYRANLFLVSFSQEGILRSFQLFYKGVQMKEKENS